MRSTIILGICLLFFSGLFSQKKDPVLFRVNEDSVRISEFEYIYNKNNGDNANYSRESIEEYLDLYIKFKLKVHRAKEMGLDTIKALQDELAGYRKQLSNSYLLDKEVTKKLLEEARERIQKDIRVSHILVKIDPNAPKELQDIAFQKALSLRSEILTSSFDEVARNSSDDKYSSRNGGDIGFLTALMPKGFYEFETAMYELAPGEMSLPIKSKAGYHILKVTDVRPARGEINVSHILIRNSKEGIASPHGKEKIDTIYRLLQSGADFGTLAKQFSDDFASAEKGGELGFFGINRYERTFEDAAFSLEKDGDYTAPFKSTIGWHVILRHAKKDMSDFDGLKRDLQNSISKDDRYKIARESLIQKIKQEGNFTENSDLLTSFSQLLDKEFYSYKWTIPEMEEKTLFSFGNEQRFSNLDFADYVKRSTRQRLRFDKATPLGEALNELYHAFIDEKTVAFEESRLEEKYPEFKALMREYEEGIFLFEATKMEVWDKASLDTIGLNSFYSKNKGMYEWKERAKIQSYSILTDDHKKARKIKKHILKKGVADAIEKFNTEENILQFQINTYERGSKELLGLKWKKNSSTDLVMPKGRKQYVFKEITELIPSSLKSMAEARGYIIADYQDYLEKKWISELKSKYDIEINEESLKNLIKSE